MRDRLNGLPKDNDHHVVMPDWDKFVTWERLEDALGGIRESLEKSSSDAAAALASARGNRSPVHVVERHSQTVRPRLLLARQSDRLTFF